MVRIIVQIFFNIKIFKTIGYALGLWMLTPSLSFVWSCLFPDVSALLQALPSLLHDIDYFWVQLYMFILIKTDLKFHFSTHQYLCLCYPSYLSYKVTLKITKSMWHHNTRLKLSTVVGNNRFKFCERCNFKKLSDLNKKVKSVVVFFTFFIIHPFFIGRSICFQI